MMQTEEQASNTNLINQDMLTAFTCLVDTTINLLQLTLQHRTGCTSQMMDKAYISVTEQQLGRTMSIFHQIKDGMQLQAASGNSTQSLEAVQLSMVKSLGILHRKLDV